MNLVDKNGDILEMVEYKTNEHNVINVDESMVTMDGYKGRITVPTEMVIKFSNAVGVV